MTKIVCISDTHAGHQELVIPECDILIHAGDFSDVGRRHQVEDFLFWFGMQPATHKVYIAGNHDMTYESHRSFKEEMIVKFPKVHYLEDSGITLEGLKIYGSPWQPRFFDWAFNLDRGNAIAAKWKKIPDDTQVLITHGPPYGILDEIDYQQVGCWDLMNRITQLKELKLHVFGHIHPPRGVTTSRGVTFVNAAICNDWNNPVNEPIVVEL
jgi:Icc-related predicted phosphoesterase